MRTGYNIFTKQGEPEILGGSGRGCQIRFRAWRPSNQPNLVSFGAACACDMERSIFASINDRQPAKAAATTATSARTLRVSSIWVCSVPPLPPCLLPRPWNPLAAPFLPLICADFAAAARAYRYTEDYRFSKSFLIGKNLRNILLSQEKEYICSCLKKFKKKCNYITF